MGWIALLIIGGLTAGAGVLIGKQGSGPLGPILIIAGLLIGITGVVGGCNSIEQWWTDFQAG